MIAMNLFGMKKHALCINVSSVIEIKALIIDGIEYNFLKGKRLVAVNNFKFS